ncbi:peptidylprolyl isomerase [Lachnospiraceae bacterium 45-P1]
MKTRHKKWRMGLAFLTLTALLYGCSARETLSSGKNGEKEYQRAETMVLVTTERLRYEEVYTEKVWNAAVDNRGTTFETVLLSQIHDFLRELKLMSMMAKEEKITLTSREKEKVKEAAEEYMRALGEAGAKEFGLTERDMENLYTDYWVSEKLVELLTEGMNLEVSDSEAKVITVSQIELSDEEKAREVLSGLSDEGADFSSIAKEYSEDPEIKKQIFYGLKGREYEEAAFSLAAGEISGVLEDSGKYYILKCVSDYDESATRTHKEQMIRQRKNEAFYSTYQAFKEGHALTVDEELWRSLSITGSFRVNADFFDIFEKICEEQES